MDLSLVNLAAVSAHFTSLSYLEIQTSDKDVFSLTRLLSLLLLLEDLIYRGTVSQTMIGVIVEKHGTSLRRLSLPELTCSVAMIIDFREACARLEDLAITILRTGGDANEVDIYTALGFYT
jgi:hypothetical protein